MLVNTVVQWLILDTCRLSAKHGDGTIFIVGLRMGIETIKGGMSVDITLW